MSHAASVVSDANANGLHAEATEQKLRQFHAQLVGRCLRFFTARLLKRQSSVAIRRGLLFPANWIRSRDFQQRHCFAGIRRLRQLMSLCLRKLDRSEKIGYVSDAGHRSEC